MTTRSYTLDPIWTISLPLLAFVIQLVIEAFIPAESKSVMHSEWGPHETLQVVVIGIAMMIGLAALIRLDWSTQKWLGAWFGLAALCCFYVTGEEISWGQHVFMWETSAEWAQVNDQNETNFHNTSSWLDQKPRLILFIGIALGGIVFPLLQRYKPSMLPKRFAAIYPSAQLIVVALLVALPYLADKILETAGMSPFTRVSEVQELYMYYFVLLYLWDLRARTVCRAIK